VLVGVPSSCQPWKVLAVGHRRPRVIASESGCSVRARFRLLPPGVGVGVVGCRDAGISGTVGACAAGRKLGGCPNGLRRPPWRGGVADVRWHIRQLPTGVSSVHSHRIWSGFCPNCAHRRLDMGCFAWGGVSAGDRSAGSLGTYMAVGFARWRSGCLVFCGIVVSSARGSSWSNSPVLSGCAGFACKEGRRHRVVFSACPSICG